MHRGGDFSRTVKINNLAKNSYVENVRISPRCLFVKALIFTYEIEKLFGMIILEAVITMKIE